MDSGACFDGFRRRDGWEGLRGWINPNLTLDMRQQRDDVWLCGLFLCCRKEEGCNYCVVMGCDVVRGVVDD